MNATTPLQLHVVLCDFQRAQASVVICVCVTEDEAEAIAARLRDKAVPGFIDSLTGLVATFRVEAAPLTDVFEQVQAAIETMGPPLRRAMRLAGKLTPDGSDKT